MSYRETRDFIERMKSLGYPRIISIENFRTPNFELVADILFWISQVYLCRDNKVNMAHLLLPSTEDDRVEFLSNFEIVWRETTNNYNQGQHQGVNNHQDLNLKRLYKADGYAIKEMLKIVNILYHGVGQKRSSTCFDSIDSPMQTLQMQDSDLVLVEKKVKDISSLASDILSIGAKLHDLLKREMELDGHENRTQALKFLDSFYYCENTNNNLMGDEETDDRSTNHNKNKEYTHIEQSILKIIDNITNDTEKLSQQIHNWNLIERKRLEEKIKVKTMDKERLLKRLKNLEDSFQIKNDKDSDYSNKLETQLKHLHHEYVLKFRNLAYLENELNKFLEQERSQKEEIMGGAMKEIQNKIKQDDLQIIQDQDQGSSSSMSSTDEESSQSTTPSIDDEEETSTVVHQDTDSMSLTDDSNHDESNEEPEKEQTSISESMMQGDVAEHDASVMERIDTTESSSVLHDDEDISFGDISSGSSEMLSSEMSSYDSSDDNSNDNF